MYGATPVVILMAGSIRRNLLSKVFPIAVFHFGLRKSERVVPSLGVGSLYCHLNVENIP